MKLYHYVHCPFCLRVRFALGHLKLSYESIVLPYDDESTPIKLSGTKMLPILEITENNCLNESLEIIKVLDKEKILTMPFSEEEINILMLKINNLGKEIHPLCMPYWVWTPEFNENSRIYFTVKKEISKGPFSTIIRNKNIYLTRLNSLLDSLELDLDPFYQSKSFSLADIIIASHLWGMYIFPEFQFSQKIHNYLQEVKLLCHFDYHQDFWK